jgi:c-di-GMP-binding flagellar brake protein YcgR
LAPDYTKTRRHPRYLIDVRLRSLAVDSVPVRTGGRLANISEGGIAVLTPAEIDLGETAEVEFHLPPAPEPLRLRVVLRNRTGFRCGFEFLTLTHSQRREIMRACQELKQQS